MPGKILEKLVPAGWVRRGQHRARAQSASATVSDAYLPFQSCASGVTDEQGSSVDRATGSSARKGTTYLASAPIPITPAAEGERARAREGDQSAGGTSTRAEQQ